MAVNIPLNGIKVRGGQWRIGQGLVFNNEISHLLIGARARTGEWLRVSGIESAHIEGRMHFSFRSCIRLFPTAGP